MENSNKYMTHKSLKYKLFPMSLYIQLLSVKDWNGLYNKLLALNLETNSYTWEDIKIFRLSSDLNEDKISETIRIEIWNLYMWEFLLSETEFTDKKKWTDNYSYKLLSDLLNNNWYLSFKNFVRIFAKRAEIITQKGNKTDITSVSNLFRKRKQILSDTLKEIFSLKSDPFIVHDRKNKIYKTKFKVEIVSENIEKENTQNSFKNRELKKFL